MHLAKEKENSSMLVEIARNRCHITTAMTLLCCLAASCAFIDKKNPDSIAQSLSALKVVGPQFWHSSLTRAQISAADSIYALPGSEYSALVEQLKAEKMGGSAFVAGGWYFRDKQFDKAGFFYELALSDIWSFSTIHSKCNAMASTAHSRIDLINNNQDYGRKPLELYAEAVTGRYPIQNRQLLERIKEKYPESSIIDDVDFKIGTYLYPAMNHPDLAGYWEDLLTRYPQSPLRARAEKRLTVIYFNLGVKKSKTGELAEAEKYYRYVLGRAPVFDHYLFAIIAKFFEGRGKLDFAEQAYKKGLHLGWPDAYAALGLFYEKHYSLERYIEFLKEEDGTSDRWIAGHLDYLKGTKKTIRVN